MRALLNTSLIIALAVCQCPLTETTFFPRKIGGDFGDTYIGCFDLQYSTSPETSRLVFGGHTLSQDVANVEGAGFLFYEDAVSFHTLWAK